MRLEKEKEEGNISYSRIINSFRGERESATEPMRHREIHLSDRKADHSTNTNSGIGLTSERKSNYKEIPSSRSKHVDEVVREAINNNN